MGLFRILDGEQRGAGDGMELSVGSSDVGDVCIGQLVAVGTADGDGKWKGDISWCVYKSILG